MEIPPTVCEKCFTSVKPYEGATSVFSQVVSLLAARAEKTLQASDFGHLALVSRELFTVLSRKVFWLGYLSLATPQNRVPAGFSVLKLFAELYARRNNNVNWKRELLTTAVTDGAADSKKLVRVHLSVSGVDSIEFWKTDQLIPLLGLSAFPTAPQETELKSIISILLERGATGAQLLDWMAEMTQKVNKVLAAVFVHHALVTPEFRKGITAESLVPALDTMRIVFDVSGLLHGVIMDDLRKEKWDLKTPGEGKKAQKTPKIFVTAVCLAMTRMSWLQLSDMFRLKGLAKQVLRETHLQAFLEKALVNCTKEGTPRWQPKHEKGLKQAIVAVSCLRGTKYPESEAEFQKTNWVERLKRPLEELNTENPLVEVDAQWVTPDQNAWQPALAGKRLKIPRSRTFESVLSQDGNSVETWDTLLASRGTTVSHVFQHWRSLIFLAYPAEKVLAFLLKRIDQLDLFKLMGVRQLLRSSFDVAVFAVIANAFEENPSDVNDPRNKGGELNRVTLGERTFQDAKGKSTAKVITRTVNSSCSQKMLDEHFAILDVLCSAKMESKVPADGTAVVLFTSELLNPLRKGQPPSIPPYSKSSLWRNESVCLSELSDAPLRKLRAGITWCEKPGAPGVDLDLSVTLFDADWQELGSCAYHNRFLKNNCVVHSGDVLQAPYPVSV